MRYCCWLEGLARDLCQTERAAKTLIPEVPKCHLRKPLPSTLLLLSLAVLVEKGDSWYPKKHYPLPLLPAGQSPTARHASRKLSSEHSYRCCTGGWSQAHRDIVGCSQSFTIS